MRPLGFRVVSRVGFEALSFGDLVGRVLSDLSLWDFRFRRASMLGFKALSFGTGI